jgi:protease-4
MRQFIKFVFASCLGVIIAGVALFFILFTVIGGIASSATAGKSVKVEPNSVLVMRLNQIIPERTNNLPMNPFEFEQNDVVGLHDMVKYIEHAKEDKNIKAIYMDLSQVQVGQATASTIRKSLLDFKSSGKPIYAYGHYYTQGAYYMASVADSIYVSPMGSVEYVGFGVTLAFFKEMLDKLGVDMQIFYAGQFKSATEPFRLNKMSDQNRLQVREYIDGMYEIFRNDIATARGMTEADLTDIANNYRVRTAEDALKYKLVDRVAYQDEVSNVMKTKLGLSKDDKLKTVTFGDYTKAVTLSSSLGEKDKIAVVYAEGTINDGSATPGEINGDNYVSILRKIRQDKSIKAVVLRVNSGGGSALASERIWREIELIKEKGIPVVATMGDVAASGGYFILAGADSIFAEPNTLTGSIGVFGILPSTQKLFNDKLGIYFDTVRTNTYATSFTPTYKLSPQEFAILQEGVETTYDRFLNIVAQGRKMTKEAVHEVAQGRVWTGSKAKDIGLVDALGGLPSAIESAASLAELSSYRLVEYPKTKDPLTQFLDQIMNRDTDNVKMALLQSEMGEMYGFYKYIKEMKELKGAQMRLPFYMELR